MDPKIFSFDIDLDRNSISNFKLNPLSTASRLALSLTTDDEGYVTYDTDFDLVYEWTGTIWKLSGVNTFLGLVDTPSSYTGANNQFVRVNSAASGIIFSTATKSDVGLGNVDNTSDVNKPISTATQTALNLKYDATNPSGYISTISGISAGGELTGTYPNPTLVNSAVIGKVLTGYISGAGVISASDSILSAIQKLNGNTATLSASQTANTFYAAPNGSAGVPSFRVIVSADIPTLNQNTTGSAATLTTGRTIAITGDLAYTSPSFNGSGNITAAGTLATVNANVGSFGSASSVMTQTVNAKGLTTAAASVAIQIAESQVTNLTSDLAAKQGTITLTTIGTSGAATLISNTLNIPQYTGGSGTVTSFTFTNGSGFTGTVTNSTSTPTLALTTSLTTNSVPFIGASGALSQDNTNFSWDNTHKWLGIGITPGFPLDIVCNTATADNLMRLRGHTGGANFVAIRIDTGTDLTFTGERGAFGYGDYSSNQPSTLTNRIFIEMSNFNISTTPPDFVLQFSGAAVGPIYWHRPILLVKGSDRSFNLIQDNASGGTGGSGTIIFSVDNNGAVVAKGLPAGTTSNVIYYDTTTGVFSYGAGGGGGGISGTGTTGYVTKWTTGGTVLGNSVLYETSSKVGLGTITPGMPLTVVGATGAPASSGTTANGAFRLEVSGYGTVLDFGGIGPAVGTQWIQVTDKNGLATTYPLALNPNGGNVGINILAPTASLHVGGAIKAVLSSATTSNVVYYDSSTNLFTYGTVSAGTNYWSRTGTTLSTATAGDGISLTGSIVTTAGTTALSQYANTSTGTMTNTPGTAVGGDFRMFDLFNVKGWDIFMGTTHEIRFDYFSGGWTHYIDFATNGNITTIGSLKTGSPSGGTAQPFKVGSIVSIGGILNTANGLQIDINGVVYTIALIT